MSLRLGIAQINVTDLDRARQFYGDVLGFQLRYYGPHQPFQLLTEQESPMILVYVVEKLVPVDYPKQTGVTLVFYTDDIEATVRRWQAAGVEFVPIKWSRDQSGIAESPFGPFIAFRDPFGNVHELLQPTGRGV